MLPVVSALLFALVQSPAPGSESAKRDFERGMRHYDVGDFEEALDAFRSAYDASPHAELLFNIGQCHRNLGQYDRAIFFFERYVEQQPDGPDAENVRSLLVDLSDRRPAIDYDPPPLDTSTVPAERPDLALPYPPASSTLGTPLVERWWFWAAVTGAVAFTAGSVVLMATLTDGDHHLPERALNLESPGY